MPWLIVVEDILMRISQLEDVETLLIEQASFVRK